MADKSASEPSHEAAGFLDGFLTTIERVGNKVPHPAIIFFILIGIVIVLSVILEPDRLVGDLRGDRPGDRTRSSTQTTTVRSLLSARRHPLHRSPRSCRTS